MWAMFCQTRAISGECAHAVGLEEMLSKLKISVLHEAIEM
jgi:hypothetical protein